MLSRLHAVGSGLIGFLIQYPVRMYFRRLSLGIMRFIEFAVDKVTNNKYDLPITFLAFAD